jgi:hypothetical protein
MWNDRFEAGQTHNPPLLHKIDTWNFGVNDVNDYFYCARPTSVVIAPGSDMPYCLVHYVATLPAAGDGWPAQAANPGAYVSLLEPTQDSDERTWHPILLSHIPTTLMPGYYVPALPMMAYCGDQWDHEHAWADGLDDPEVILMESNFPVEMCPYQFTSEAYAAGTGAVIYTFPWLLTPIAAGLVASSSNLVWSKALGIGGSNRTGSAQTAAYIMRVYTKNRTFPDIVANFEDQDFGQISALADGARSNTLCERFGWMKPEIQIDANGGTPAGVGYIVF